MFPSYDLLAPTRANGDRRSHIDKHVVVSAFSAGRQLCILYEHRDKEL